MQNYKQPRPGPVTHGSGAGDLASDARHFTVFALQAINALMENSEDEKLRFACAKYLLEQGWGRPAARRLETTAPEIDPELSARIYRMLDRLREAEA